MENTYNPLISWIVPAYNVEKYIIDCLNSLVSIGLPKDCFEVLVVDDGSTDNTLSLTEGFAAKHPSIKVFTQENRGLSITRNRAIEMAQGDYIHFVDADDFIINVNQYIQCIKFALKNDLDISPTASCIINQ